MTVPLTLLIGKVAVIGDASPEKLTLIVIAEPLP
jgi:hypothetical protein